MTAHSEQGGVILMPSEAMQDRFVDVAKTRDWFLNNLVHLYDESFQLRVAWSVHTGQDGDRPAEYSTGYKLVSRDPFPVTIRADGHPAPLVVRFSTKRNHDVTSADATWRVIAHGFNDAVLAPTYTDSDRIDESAHNTDDSKEHGPFTLQMSPGHVTSNVYTSDISKGGDVAPVTVFWAEVSVWVASAADPGQDTIPAELRSLNVREYVGDE